MSPEPPLSDRDALAALLPAPRVQPLSARREAHLRRVALDGTRSRRLVRGRPTPWVGRVGTTRVLAAGLSLTVLAATVIVIITLAGSPTSPGHRGGADPATVAVARAGGSGAPLLREAADVIGRVAQPIPGPRSWEFTESVASTAVPVLPRTIGAAVRASDIVRRQTWLAQSPPALHSPGSGIVLDGVPQPEYELGVFRVHGHDTPIIANAPTGITYTTLARYPTRPRALLARIAAMLRRDGQVPSGIAEFQRIGELLDDMIIPAPVTAAMYRAAALIPGVRVIPHSRDVAGRPGVGVALTRAGIRAEWIFAAHSHAFLGMRDETVRVSDAGPAGTVLFTSAVLRRGVVDHAGELPTP